uniref:Peptidase S1 domain-containing protein n=1 Tax=Panagrolaimus sp. PS1159 TaxID=55785 RepID=A0AC35GFD8_9BILA
MLISPAFVIDFRPEQPLMPIYWKSVGLATKTVYHPDWSFAPNFDDISIIELPAEIDDIVPVLLAKDYVARKGDMGINVGYGDTNPDLQNSQQPETLMEINIPILSKQECKHSGEYKA